MEPVSTPDSASCSPIRFTTNQFVEGHSFNLGTVYECDELFAHSIGAVRAEPHDRTWTNPDGSVRSNVMYMHAGGLLDFGNAILLDRVGPHHSIHLLHLLLFVLLNIHYQT